MRFLSLFSRSGLLAALALVALAGCRKDHFADGIGRPLPETIESPVLVTVSIVEVLPAATGGFVELLASQGAVLTGFKVVVVSGAANVSVNAPGSLTAGQRIDVALPDLDTGTSVNAFQSGEVALVDAAGIVHAYLAWGADPSTFGSSLFVAALQSGVTTISSVVPIRFPRASGTAIVRETTLVGCYAPTPNAPSAATDVCSNPPQSIALREVAPQNSPVTASYVELENISGAALDVTGVRLCHDGSCSALPPLALAPAQVLVACFGTTTSSSAACPASGIILAGSTAIAGDTEAYVAAPGSVIDEDTLIDYMRTKLAAQTFALEANKAILWSADPNADAPTGTYVPGESLSRNPGPLSPPAWNPARATPGAPNPTIDRLTNWQTCAEPATTTPPAQDPLIVSVLSRVDGTITLTNTQPVTAIAGANDLLLDAYAILIDGTELTSNGAALTGPLKANSSLTFAAPIGDAGKLEVRRRVADVLEQFAQWGNPAAGVSAAVTASLWPREDCVLPRLAVGESLVIRDSSLIRGSGGYGVQ